MATFSQEQKKEMMDMMRQVYQEEFNRNYISGVPRVPPHTHNGIDNLPISSSGGGGTPGGDNTDIQFNNDGAFGGDPTFTFDPATSTLGVLNIKNTNGTTDSEIESDLNIGTVDAPFDPGTGVGTLKSAAINIKTGDSNLEIGGINIETGDATGNPNPNQPFGDDINIKTGFAYGDAGDINITAGASVNSSSGDVTITSGNPIAGSAGAVSFLTYSDGIFICIGSSGGVLLFRSNNGTGSSVNLEATGTGGTINLTAGDGITLLTASSFYVESTGTGNRLRLSDKIINFGYADVDVSGMTEYDGTLTIADKLSGAAVTGTPTGGGLLYSNGGALHWLGSGGTDTVIAPA